MKKNTVHEWETDTPTPEQCEKAHRELVEALFQTIWPALEADMKAAAKHPARKFLSFDED